MLPDQAWAATTTCGAEERAASMLSGGRCASTCPQRFVGTVFKPVLGRRTQQGSIMLSLRTMSHSHGHKVSVCFQNAQCCARIFRNVSLLIGISEDIFAHWPSIDINGALIPSVIVGDSAYPYWLFLLRSFRRYLETGLVWFSPRAVSKYYWNMLLED